LLGDAPATGAEKSKSKKNKVEPVSIAAKALARGESPNRKSFRRSTATRWLRYAALLEDEKIRKTSRDAKYITHRAAYDRHHAGGVDFDTMIASYVLIRSTNVTPLNLLAARISSTHENIDRRPLRDGKRCDSVRPGACRCARISSVNRPTLPVSFAKPSRPQLEALQLHEALPRNRDATRWCSG